MDFKPIPPDGKVADLRQQNHVKTEEEIAEEKKQKHERVRRNLRLVAIGLACYYFISAGYSWYEESQLDNVQIVAAAHNPLQTPQAFRDTFNTLLNEKDTSLPLANANDTKDGFVAVLSTALEIKGYAKPDSKELQAVQIQTRYPEALPPESLKGFQTFVLACERMVDKNASPAFADEVLLQLGITPKLDANEDDKVFSPTTVHSSAYEYKTAFMSGPIDELTLVATPRINIATVQPDEETLAAANEAAAAEAASAETAETAETVEPVTAEAVEGVEVINQGQNDVPVL